MRTKGLRPMAEITGPGQTALGAVKEWALI